MEDFGESLDFQGEQRGEGAQSSLTKFIGGGGGGERKEVSEGGHYVIRIQESLMERSVKIPL